MESPSPSPEASEDDNDDSDDTMMMLRMGMLAHLVMMRCLLDVLIPLSIVTKRGSSFEIGVVIVIGGGLV